MTILRPIIIHLESTFINFLWFILLFIQSYLSLAEAFNWFPSDAKNDNNNDDSLNGDDLASSFAARLDIIMSRQLQINKQFQCLQKTKLSQIDRSH